MKNFNLLLFAAAAAFVSSCGGAAEEKMEETAEAATYTMDMAASSLTWTGMKSAEDKHSGTIKMTKGSVETLGDALTSGSFTIDMKSLSTTDDMPADKVEMLNGHLKAEDFFNVEKYPTATVKVGEYKDGKLPTTITLMGVDFINEVPVNVEMKDDKVMITGSFDFDFSGISTKGFTKNPESGEQIQSLFKFDLNLVLIK